MHPNAKLLRAIKTDQDGYVTNYRSKYGRRREFPTQSEADAYDRGWMEYSTNETPQLEGPYWLGWWDSFSADEERAMESMELPPEDDDE